MRQTIFRASFKGFKTMGFADDWGKVYNKSIQAFTGRKKVAVRELDDVVNGGADLVKSLTVLDQNDPTVGAMDEKPKRFKAFAAEQKNLNKAAAKYGAAIDVALKKTDKDIWPDANRELKVLRKQLDLITTKVESKIAGNSKEYDKAQQKAGAKIDKATNKMRKEGATDEEIKAETNFLKQKRLLIEWPKITKAAFARAAATIQKIKADPTPATYNTEMNSGGRDMTQQMSNLIKLLADNKCPDKLKALMNGLSGHRAHLAEFGDGAKRRIDDASTKNQVLAQTKEFADLTKEMIPYYDKMVKYLAKHKL